MRGQPVEALRLEEHPLALPERVFEGLVHQSAESPTDAALRVSSVPGDRRNMIHKEGTALITMGEDLQRDNWKVVLLRYSDLSLAPLSTGVEVRADHQQCAAAGSGVKFRLPLAAGLQVVRVE